MSDESWKLIDLLNTVSDYFSEKQFAHPRRNAEALLGKALALPRLELYLQFDRPLKPEEVASYRTLVKRRLEREPLQQILGKVEFLDAAIETPRGLLVPRPETEWLVAETIDHLGTESTIEAPRILDCGCGTGCISVALAMKLGGTQITAIDIDPLAVETTRRNAAANGVADAIQSLELDLMDSGFAGAFEAPFDLVISNPPYVRERDYEQLAPEIRHFENPAALLGGDDGLKFYRRLRELMPRLLAPGGMFALELGCGQAKSVEDLFADEFQLEVLADLNAVERVILGKRKTA